MAKEVTLPLKNHRKKQKRRPAANLRGNYRGKRPYAVFCDFPGKRARHGGKHGKFCACIR